MVFWVWVLLFTIIIVYSFDSLGYSKLTLLFSAHVEPRSVGGRVRERRASGRGLVSGRDVFVLILISC